MIIIERRWFSLFIPFHIKAHPIYVHLQLKTSWIRRMNRKTNTFRWFPTTFWHDSQNLHQSNGERAYTEQKALYRKTNMRSQFKVWNVHIFIMAKYLNLAKRWFHCINTNQKCVCCMYALVFSIDSSFIIQLHESFELFFVKLSTCRVKEQKENSKKYVYSSFTTLEKCKWWRVETIQAKYFWANWR